MKTLAKNRLIQILEKAGSDRVRVSSLAPGGFDSDVYEQESKWLSVDSYGSVWIF